MLTIKSDNVIFAMSPDNNPVARIRDGETLVFETVDCFDGQLSAPSARTENIDWSRINAATGPVFVEGAMPGDTLKVEILNIDLAPQAVIMEGPGKGVTGVAAEAESIRILPIENGKLVFNDSISLPLRPMIGVIGTAPAGEDIETDTPSGHGGNMDCKRIGPGTTLYLPVNVEGALLAMGDLHALMGDGEVCVCGAEIAGSVTVRVSIVKGQPLPLPFLLTEEHAMAIHSAKTIDAAAEGAALNMRNFLIDYAKLPSGEAGMLLSLAGDLCICQAVDPKRTCRMELPLSILRSLNCILP